VERPSSLTVTLRSGAYTFPRPLAMLEKDAQKLESLIPNGIRYRKDAERGNNVRLRTAMTYVRRIMRKHTPEEIKAAEDMLRRLDAQGAEFPYLSNPADGVSSFKPGQNQVIFPEGGDIALRKDGEEVVPGHMTLVHELGHWAYQNMLSPRERM